jgi:hypothetical protein
MHEELRVLRNPRFNPDVSTTDYTAIVALWLTTVVLNAVWRRLCYTGVSMVFPKEKHQKLLINITSVSYFKNKGKNVFTESLPCCVHFLLL